MMKVIRRALARTLFKQELAELERWRASHEAHSRQLMTNYDAIKVLENIKADVDKTPSVHLGDLNHNLTRQKLISMEREFKRGYQRRDDEVMAALV